jgi:hypothetical protein
LDDWFAAANLNFALARPGHNRSFPTRSKKLAQRTDEWPVSGDEPERFVGSSRPFPDAHDRQLPGTTPCHPRLRRVLRRNRAQPSQRRGGGGNEERRREVRSITSSALEHALPHFQSEQARDAQV